ncbi:hypothetical protein OSTOST_14691 [Ostertagia ostertagi]
MELLNGTPRKGSTLCRCSLLVLLTSALVFLRLYINDFTAPKFTELDNAAAFVPDPFPSVDRVMCLGRSKQLKGYEKMIYLHFQLASYSNLWLINLRLLVLPYALCFDYSMGCVPVVQNWTDFRALALPAVVAVVLGGTYVLFKTNDR